MKKSTICILLILMFAALGIFGYSLGKLYYFYWEYQKGENTYEELLEYVEEPGKNDFQEEESKENEYIFIKVDFPGLKEVNPDVIAWIHIPALEISYPVVQGTDNSYYLYHMFDGKKNSSGSIFVDCNNANDFSDTNTIVYGHNMKNGTMFGELDRYQNEELFQEYPYFYIYVPDGILVYQIVSCYIGKINSSAYTYSFNTENDINEFFDVICQNSLYDINMQLNSNDKIVTLSTCVNSNKNNRFLIHGKLETKVKITN